MMGPGMVRMEPTSGAGCGRLMWERMEIQFHASVSAAERSSPVSGMHTILMDWNRFMKERSRATRSCG